MRIMSQLTRCYLFFLGTVLILFGLWDIYCSIHWHGYEPILFWVNVTPPYARVLYICDFILTGGLLIAAAWKRYMGGAPFYIGLLLLFFGLIDIADIVRLYTLGIQNDFSIGEWFAEGLGKIVSGIVILWFGHRRHRRRQRIFKLLSYKDSELNKDSAVRYEP
jgi:hypothetical protein